MLTDLSQFPNDEALEESEEPEKPNENDLVP